MSKHFHGYKINRGYTRLTVWSFWSATREKFGTIALIPNKGLTRRQRYDEIAETLKHFAKVPAYKPAKREAA